MSCFYDVPNYSTNFIRKVAQLSSKNVGDDNRRGMVTYYIDIAEAKKIEDKNNSGVTKLTYND